MVGGRVSNARTGVVECFGSVQVFETSTSTTGNRQQTTDNRSNKALLPPNDSREDVEGTRRLSSEERGGPGEKKKRKGSGGPRCGKVQYVGGREVGRKGERLNLIDTWCVVCRCQDRYYVVRTQVQGVRSTDTRVTCRRRSSKAKDGWVVDEAGRQAVGGWSLQARRCSSSLQHCT